MKKKTVIKVRSNRNAHIVNRTDKNGNVRTETRNRDEDSKKFAVSTNAKTNSTYVFIDDTNVNVKLTGREARTLYRLLQKHYTSF